MPKTTKITAKPGEYDIIDLKTSEDRYMIIPEDYDTFLTANDKTKIQKSGDKYKLILDASEPERNYNVEVIVSDRVIEGYYYLGSYNLSDKIIVTFKCF